MIPKGNLLKQKHPYGVMNVISSLDSFDRGTCQKPLLVSNLVKILAPDSWASVMSTLGSG